MSLYHGTRRGFTRGGYIFPVEFHGGEARPGHQGEDSTAYAYATTDRDLAVDYAMQAKGRAAPRVLLVEPIGDLEDDPSSYDGERGVQVRSQTGFRVIKVEILSDRQQAEWHRDAAEV